MARSLNKVTLIGNLTRDPELRYTPQGTAVCSFGIATNRQWTVDSGEKKEDVEFHRIVAWNKLAEICAQLLKKGRKVYVEGRLQTRSWEGQDGTPRTTTEIVISEMILLDSSRAGVGEDFNIPEPPEATADEAMVEKKEGAGGKGVAKSDKKVGGAKQKASPKSKKASADVKASPEEEDFDDEDIPF